MRASLSRSSNGREARGDAMFPLPALITRELRPVERSVARRRGLFSQYWDAKSYLSCIAAPARHSSALSARGTSRRMVHSRTRCSAQGLLIFERVSESKLREQVKQNKDHAE